MAKVNQNFSLDADLLKKVKTEAKRLRRNKSAHLNEILRERYELQKAQAEGQRYLEGS